MFLSSLLIFIQDMKFSEFLRRVMFYVTVPECVGCKEKLSVSDIALCHSCSKKHELLKTKNCSRCSNILSNCTCSNTYLEKHRVKRLIKAYRYLITDEISPSNNLIFSLKKETRRDVLHLLTGELELAIINSGIDVNESCIFTNVPRRKKAIAQYGIDHAGRLSKSLAKRFGAEYKSTLRSMTKREQKGMKFDDRKKNAAFSQKGKYDLKGKTVFLIDDIVTTGSSMAASADILYRMGAKAVIGVAVAIAYRDSYIPFPKQDYVYW